ncbi:MAG: alginate export family protein [Marinobacter sp.]|nr:alginate export family protein [Marinobacter sp.]
MRMVSGVLALSMAAATGAVQAQNVADSISQALKEGTAEANFRYRYEYVNQEDAGKESHASTLRSRLTWTSGTAYGVRGRLEVDNVSSIGTDRYNSTVNGKPLYAAVPDPVGTDINQAWLSYTLDQAELTYGRQRINHGNQRFLGGVGWRQNEQTYDAARITAKPMDGVTLDYSYIWRVHTIFGADSPNARRDGDIHAFLGTWAVAPGHTLAAYGYLMDFDDFVALSNVTYGVDYRGRWADLVDVQLAVAQQSDTGDSPKDYDALYYLASVAGNLGPVRALLGYEVLGSDSGDAAFITPLATLHAFQGFTDKFLVTPDDGIRNLYLTLSGKVGAVGLSAGYHQFKADNGGADYGDEINVTVTVPVMSNVSAMLKAARYNADDFGADTDKVWLMLTAGF